MWKPRYQASLALLWKLRYQASPECFREVRGKLEMVEVLQQLINLGLIEASQRLIPKVLLREANLGRLVISFVAEIVLSGRLERFPIVLPCIC